MSISRKGRVYYFAYGANLSLEQMTARCLGTPRIIGPARLPGHQLVFHGHSERWDGAEETEIAQPGATLWGVIYDLALSALDRLDAWQGVRMDGSGAYFHSPADVTTPDGASWPVLLYRKDILGPPALPSRDYLAHIVAGARAQGLPADYVEALAAHPSQPARYLVPKTLDGDRILGGLSCAC